MEILHVTEKTDIKILNKQVRGIKLPLNLKNDKICVLKKNNKLISMVYYSVLDDYITFNYIYTDQNFRRLGMSEKIIRYILSSYEEIKKYDVMILPKSNSDKLFEKLNFVFVGDNRMILEL